MVTHKWYDICESLDRSREYEIWWLDETRLVTFPKKGDLHDLNNWLGVNLLDATLEIMNIV